MSSDDGVGSANHEKGGDGMESDLDGLKCFNQFHHPYPAVTAI
jgi:hypothetical protein